MTTKHFATLPDGSVATRSSKNRTYSHCVAGRLSYESAMADAKRVYSYYASNFAYHTREANPATAVHAHDYQSGVRRRFEGAEMEAHNAKHAAFLGGAGNVAEYTAAQIAGSVASVEALKAAGHFDKWHAICWAGRRDLAEKAASGYRSGRFAGVYAEVRVIAAETR